MTIENSNPEVKQERNKIFSDFYSNIIPSRMPVTFTLPHHLIAQYAGVSPFEFQYDFSLLKAPAFELCSKVYSDSCPVSPVGPTTRPPLFYGFLGSNSFVMGQNGYVQHPEVSGMNDDEYDELIDDPIKFLVEKVIPRQYGNFDVADPCKMLGAVLAAKASVAEDGMVSAEMCKGLKDTYGYYDGAPRGSGGFTAAPYDFIADQLRGFKGISMDVRRKKDKIKTACEALLPLVFLQGMPASPHKEGAVGMPLHMPTFMQEKDFAELWLPSFKTLAQQFAARGSRISAFCEDNWMRYLDYLTELPVGLRFKFEYGDAKEIKAKLGDKYIISGLYPLKYLKTATKQECIDKAKELLDIMLPGGGYIFDFDKVPLTLGDINLDNYIALSEFVRDYAHYDNAGEAYGVKLNSEGFVADDKIKTLPSTKCNIILKDEICESFCKSEKVDARKTKYDNEMLKFCLGLLL